MNINPGEFYKLKISGSNQATIKITYPPSPIIPAFKVEDNNIYFTYLETKENGMVTRGMFEQFIDNGYLTKIMVE